MTYLIVFAIGGGICMVGQVIINLTKLTSARILLIFLLLGVLLEAIGVFGYMKDFAKAGVTIPIMGFGSNLAKGAIEGARESGLFGAITGGVKAAAAGLTGAIFIGFVVSLISKPHSKS
ncbi:MAG: SpoVA/SpoVAEb family sporulation membrane protein [Clostridia bacterium]|nr:SpoVA/SpoVAEb family sporulation membrane protein [Clostridia bacterium]